MEEGKKLFQDFLTEILCRGAAGTADAEPAFIGFLYVIIL